MMRRLYASFPRWLFPLCLSACALSLCVWLGGLNVRLALLLVLLAVWSAALVAADRAWGVPGALGLLGLTVCLPLLFWNQEALWSWFGFAARRAERSATGDLILFLFAALLAVGALYLLRSFWLRLALCVGWVAFWITAALWELWVPRLALGAMLPLLLFTLSETVHRLLRRKADFRAFAPALAMLFSLSVFVAALPVSPEPYPYPLVHALLDRVETLYRRAEGRLRYRTPGDEQFTVDFNGFSEAASAGERVGEEAGQSFFITAERQPTGPLYLAGNSWDTYRNRIWYETADGRDDDLLDWNLDTAERLYALWRARRSGAVPSAASLLRENGLTVSCDRLQTRTLFTLPDTLRIRADGEKYPFSAHAGRVLFDYVQDRDTVYTLRALEPQAPLDALIRASEGYAYDLNDKLRWERVYRDLADVAVLSMDGSVSVEPLLARRQALIRRTYLDLPEELSPAVRSLAAELTAPYGSDYEKLNAIARYLRENYRYTASPAPAPEGVSLLDHLLFDAREGYCTWYATAATLLARAAGIPARYVQGCRVEAAEGGVPVRVGGAESHAWCEGYVSGYGWVLVEATPGFAGPGAQQTAPAEQAPPRPSRPHAFFEAPIEEGGTPVVLPAPEPPPAEEPAEDASPGGAASAPESAAAEPAPAKRSPLPTALLLILFALALAAAALFRARRERARRAYEAADYAGRAVLDLRALLGYLARRGYPRDPADTIPQHFAKVRWRYLMVDEAEAARMARLYEQVLFGGRVLERGEWETEKRFVDALAPRRFTLRAFLRAHF